MAEEQKPLIVDYDMDSPFILRSDGTPDGTQLVRKDGAGTFPPFDKSVLKAVAGKQVVMAQHQIAPSEVEIKIVGTNGVVYTLKSEPYEGDNKLPSDPCQGFDLDFTAVAPDGTTWAGSISSFKFAATAGKLIPTVEIEHGMVDPDVKVTDESGTYYLHGHGGQGFDCELLGPDQLPIPGVQWAEFTMTGHGTILEYFQAEQAPEAERSVVHRRVSQPMAKSQAELEREAAELELIKSTLSAHYGEPVQELPHA